MKKKILLLFFMLAIGLLGTTSAYAAETFVGNGYPGDWNCIVFAGYGDDEYQYIDVSYFEQYKDTGCSITMDIEYHTKDGKPYEYYLIGPCDVSWQKLYADDEGNIGCIPDVYDACEEPGGDVFYLDNGNPLCWYFTATDGFIRINPTADGEWCTPKIEFNITAEGVQHILDNTITTEDGTEEYGGVLFQTYGVDVLSLTIDECIDCNTYAYNSFEFDGAEYYGDWSNVSFYDGNNDEVSYIDIAYFQKYKDTGCSVTMDIEYRTINGTPYEYYLIGPSDVAWQKLYAADEYSIDCIPDVYTACDEPGGKVLYNDNGNPRCWYFLASDGFIRINPTSDGDWRTSKIEFNITPAGVQHLLDSVETMDDGTKYGGVVFQSYGVEVSTLTIGDPIDYNTTSLSEGEVLEDDAFEYVILENGDLEVISYFGDDEKVEIPSEWLGRTVSSIADEVFMDCDFITSVIIPDSVTSIGEYAFYGCTGIETLDLGNGVEIIGDSAFGGCSNLDTVSIPASVQSIGLEVFIGCESLTGITVDSKNKCYSSSSGVLFNKNKTALIQYPVNKTGKAYTIPDTVTNIAGAAFYGADSLVTVTIPDSVTYIGNNAFEYCSSLTSITIPAKVSYLGYYAFGSCESLQNVRINKGVESVDNYAFYGCYNLISVSLPSTVTSIGCGVFQNCTSLENISIPSGVTKIGADAFYGCASLVSIKLPEGLKMIDEGSFGECTSLEKVNIPDSVIHVGDAFWGTAILNAQTTDVKYIDGWAVYCARDVESVKIMSGTKGLSNHLFFDCDYLTSVTLNNDLEIIGDWSFYDASLVEKVIVPSGVKIIGDGAFSWCDNLTSITIPNSVTSIGRWAFEGTDSVVINCKYNSYAHDYAVNNDIPYEILLPSVPENLRMTSHSDSTITLSWDAVDGADGYTVEQLINGKWQRISKQSRTKLTVSNLSSATEYSFRVRAYVMINGKGEFSPAAVTDAITKPSKTTGKMTAHTTNSVTLTWDTVEGADGYIIEKLVDGKWQRAAKLVGGAKYQYRLTGLESGTLYEYRIKSYKFLGNKAYFSTVSDTIKAMSKPAKTVGSVVTTTTDSATLKWETVNGADGYVIEVYVGNGVWERAAKVTGGAKSQYRLTGLTSKTTYKYRIKAYKFLDTRAYFATGCDTITARTK